MTTKPSKHELTHARIVDVAAKALRRSGYDGVRVAEVMGMAGLTHGGFYAHFPDRAGLVVEAVEQAARDSARGLAQDIARRRARGASPFRALVESYLSTAHRDAVESGCPVAALGSEMHRQSGDVRAASRAALAGLERSVRDNLPAHAGVEQVPLICASLVGALQIARGIDSASQAKDFLARCRASLLKQYEPAA